MDRANAFAAIPSDYPKVVATNRGGAAPGYLIGAIGGGNGSQTYYVVLDNSGTNLVYASTTNALLRFMTPQGFATTTDGGSFRFADESLETVDAFTAIGYNLDTHDVKLLPNGHALVLGIESRAVDLSTVVAGGSGIGWATGNVIQELDANKRLVFEWHAFDYIAISNSFGPMVDYTHGNAVAIDPTDNHLLVSFRNTSEIVKINRSTGEVMWRLGGKMNQFTFVNETANGPYYTVGQHDVHRLANGNLLFFDNGSMGGDYITPRSYSRVVEYALDEVNKIATLVWEYRHVPDIEAICQGSVKRMANGNTLIDWGCASGLFAGTIVTEVNPSGQVVFEMTRCSTNGASLGGMRSSLTKQLWSSPDLIRSTVHPNIQAGQTYDAPPAGVSVTVNRLAGESNTALVVERHLDAVRFPEFSGKAPQVVMEHLVLSGSNAVSWEAVLNLSAPDTSYVFDTPMIHDPAQVVVYHRATPGRGEFVPLPTTWDAAAQKYRVTTAQLGEFIFAYPDVSETPYEPSILSPADGSSVNQAQPVTLAWSPQGMVASFDLQVATDPDFGNLLLDQNDLGSNRLTLPDLLPNTQYFWRVRAVNQGGASEWASASFLAMPPTIRVTVPAGGEVWQCFQTVTLRWTANISGAVAIDLFKEGVSNQIVTASAGSGGAYSWTIRGVFFPITPGTNYVLRVRSLADGAVVGWSGPFCIVADLTSVTIATEPAGLAVTVDGTNYTTPARFSWLPSSSHSLATSSPQLASDGQTHLVFASWSDGGAPGHSLTVPFSASTNTARFVTNHLPVVADMQAWVVAGSVLVLPIPSLLSLGSDADGDILSFGKVTSPTTNGASVSLTPTNTLVYTPVAGATCADRIDFTLDDKRSGLGDGRVFVTVLPTNALRCTSVSATIAGEAFCTAWAGVPGFNYAIEYAPTMNGPWTWYENKNAGTNGFFRMTPFVSRTTTFFRIRYPAY